LTVRGYVIQSASKNKGKTMTDATDSTGKYWLPPAGVELKDASVNVSDIDPVLQSFLVRLGLIHLHLFNAPVVVTSGKDAIHAASSKHYKGDAVDLRITDLPPGDQPAFLLILRVLCDKFCLAMFDETYAPGMGHVHVEIAG
jgi:hypothetical protein